MTPGGTGTLAIAGGSVDIGALRLHSGGTIHLESGLFAVDSLPTLNGAFTWTAGEVRFDAASTQLDDFLATKLLGPAKTLRAGQTLGTPLLGGQVVEIFTGLTVDGGTISPAALSNFGTLDFRSGSVGGLITTTNTGLVQLGGPLARFGAGGGITNSGTIRGSGQLSGSFTNASSGRVEIIAGERLILNTGAAAVNAGTMSVIGGELQVNDLLTNAAGTGLISARDALLFFSGVVNNGAFTFSNGTVDVFGDITQNAGGRITVSNGGIASFYDDVIIQPGAASVHATALGSIVSRVVFFGSYNGGLTGGGQAFIEGDHRPGHSPALITFGGGVAYGTFANLEMELGGTARGTQHDALNVTRDLTFGGTLTVTLTGGFLPQAGQAFDLFDFDAALDAGSFDTITLPSLAAGLAWDTSALYTTGTLSVIALTPLEQWRLLYFDSPANSGDGSDDNDFDKDGASNLIEYALGLHPRVPSAAGLPQLSIVTAGASRHAALTITRPLGVPDINYRFEVTADLASFDAGSFYGVGGEVPTNAFTTQVARTNDGITETITIRDNIPLTAAARRFLRLKVTNPLP